MTRKVELEVIGCGDAFCSGGRNHTCFLLHDAHGTLAIDFGATSLLALRGAGVDPNGIDHILLSHFHGDHMGGLPFLLLEREFSDGPPTPLTIAGPPGLPERLRTLTEAMFPGTWRDPWRFALTLLEIAPDMPVTMAGRRILTKAVLHPMAGFTATALRVESGGKVLAYSGDTSWTEALIDISRDADLFICECFEHTEQPYVGHLSLPVLLHHLPEITARRTVLTHLGPDMIAARANLPLEALGDGARLTL